MPQKQFAALLLYRNKAGVKQNIFKRFYFDGKIHLSQINIVY